MIEFKRAQLEDLETLLSLLPLYYADDHLPYDSPLAEHGLRQLITDPQLGEAWLIVTNKNANAIGYLLLTFGFGLEFGGKVAWVDELFLRQDFRGKGFGSRAIAFAKTRCLKNDVRGLRMEVTRKNTRALSLYKKLGFQDLDRHLLTISIPTK